MTALTVANCRPSLDAALVHWTPPDAISGSGIVIPAGGRYLPDAFCVVMTIRNLGCPLPIQLWQLPGEDIDPKRQVLLSGVGVTIRRASNSGRRLPLVGWSLKAHALLRCGWEKALYLDADCFPQVNPSTLLQQIPSPTCLWPDVKKCRVLETIWTALRLPKDVVPEHESGQMMFDLGKAWKVLRAVEWANDHRDFFYPLQHGDKDLYGQMAAVLGEPFWTGPAPTWHGWGIRHFFNGHPAFEHHLTRKRKPTDVPEQHQEWRNMWKIA